MAVEFLSASDGNSSTGSLTFSHTVASGSNLLVLLVAWRNTTTLTGVTFNGTAMTHLHTQTSTQTGNNARNAAIYYVANPTITTANVVISTSGTNQVTGAALNFSGANTASPFGTPATAANAPNQTAIGGSPASTASDICVDIIATTGVPSADSGQTVRATPATAACSGYVSTKPGSAGSTAMGWTFGSNSIGESWIGVAIQPSAGGGGGEHTLTGESASQDAVSSAGAVSSQTTHDLSGEATAWDALSSEGAVTSEHLVAGEGAIANADASEGAVATGETIDVRVMWLEFDATYVTEHTLAANSAEQGADCDAGEILQDAQLVGTGGVIQDIVASESAVTSEHLLIGDDAEQGTASSAAGTDSEHILTAEGAEQGALSAEAAVATEHVLAGDATAQATTDTAGAVTSAHFLAGAGDAHATLATGGAVGTSGSLTADAARQDAVATDGAVAQAHLLGGAVSEQPVAADGGDVIQEYRLTADGTWQWVTCDPGEVSQVHLLTAGADSQTALAAGGAVTLIPATELAAGADAQGSLCAEGAADQIHVLVAAPVAIDSVASASALVQAQMLTASGVVQGVHSSAGAVVDASLPIYTDGVRVLAVPYEDRVLVVAPEDRTLVVAQEFRTIQF